MAAYLRSKSLPQDALLICRFELRRQGGKVALRGRLLRAMLAAVLGGAALLAIGVWMPPMWSYLAALGLQPAGLGPEVPAVHDLDEIPLWSISDGYLVFSWGIFLTLVWARVYAAAFAAASIHRDRTGSQEEMLALSSLSEGQILLGKVLAPFIAIAGVGTAVLLLIAPVALREGAPPLVVLRVWADFLFQGLSVSALCVGVASRVRRRGALLPATVLTSLLGVSAVLWLHGRLLLKPTTPWWSSVTGGSWPALPWADTRSYWVPLLGLLLLGFGLARLRPGEGRRQGRRIVLLAVGMIVLAAGWLAPRRLISGPQPGADVLTEHQRVALQRAVDQIALRNEAAALRLLDRAGGARGAEEVRIARVCGLFDGGQYEAAERACLSLRPMKLGALALLRYPEAEAACQLACGRPRNAARVRRFWWRLIELRFNGVRSPAPASEPDKVALELADFLPSMADEPRLPARAVYLRWAVRRFPDVAAFRTQFRDELRRWAALQGGVRSGYAPSVRVRKALLEEVAQDR